MELAIELLKDENYLAFKIYYNNINYNNMIINDTFIGKMIPINVKV